MERKDGIGFDVNQWFAIHSIDVGEAMEEERLAVLRSLATLPNKVRDQYLMPYSLSNRLPCEMSLCTWPVKMKTPLPGGLVYNRGAVVTSGETLFHAYLQSEDGVTYCTTPGQFIDPRNTELKPGARVRIIEELAPDMIRRYPNGLVVLAGFKNDIYDRLGLLYC